MNGRGRLLESERLIFRSAVDISASHFLLEEYRRRLRNLEGEKQAAIAHNITDVGSHLELAGKRKGTSTNRRIARQYRGLKKYRPQNVAMETRDYARILIIDDDPALLEALADTLRIKLFRVVIAAANNGAEGLSRAGSDCYDIILCDVSMADINGLTLLSKLKHIGPDSAIIMMTGEGEESISRMALRLGAIERINKPFDRLTLVRILKEVLQAQRQKNRRTSAHPRTDASYFPLDSQTSR